MDYPKVHARFKEKIKNLEKALGPRTRGVLGDLAQGRLVATVDRKVAARVVSGEGEEDDDIGTLSARIDLDGEKPRSLLKWS